jgi:hypothetical protein
MYYYKIQLYTYLLCRAGPRDADFPDRLREEYKALIAVGYPIYNIRTSHARSFI